MAQGDTDDFVRRIRRGMPASWFADEAPVLRALLRGLAATWVRLHAQLAWVLAQLRLATASGDGLDVLALDFLGDRVVRREGETDARFRLRVRREILRPKVTRQALSDVLEELTGHRPAIFEPARTSDTGGIGTGAFALNAAGGIGTRLLPFQCLVTAYRPVGDGPPDVSGFDCPPGGLGEGAFALQSAEDLARGVTDADIREAVVSTIAAGTVVWLRIRPFSEAPGGARLDEDFVLDVSRLS